MTNAFLYRERSDARIAFEGTVDNDDKGEQQSDSCRRSTQADGPAEAGFGETGQHESHDEKRAGGRFLDANSISPRNKAKAFEWRRKRIPAGRGALGPDALGPGRRTGNYRLGEGIAGAKPMRSGARGTHRQIELEAPRNEMLMSL
jgi:hypothetical protein